MAELIVAVFDTTAHADAAERDLEQSGIPSSAIERYRAGETGAPSLRSGSATSQDALTEEDRSQQPAGFWARLFGEEGNSDYHTDRAIYESHHAAGRVMIAVDAIDHTQAAHVMSILEKHAPSEIEAQPENETISPATTEQVGTPLTNIETPHSANVELPSASAGGTAANQTAQMRSGAGANTSEEVIPLSEEQIKVGKGVVDRGTTRIRRYVVDRPVEETITLRDETTSVERRAATGAVPTNAFAERTVEVTNTSEQPIVEKTARVVEEVVVNRAATERVETVKDTVRREEVEIDNGGKGADFPAATPERTAAKSTTKPRQADRA